MPVGTWTHERARVQKLLNSGTRGGLTMITNGDPNKKGNMYSHPKHRQRAPANLISPEGIWLADTTSTLFQS